MKERNNVFEIKNAENVKQEKAPEIKIVNDIKNDEQNFLDYKYLISEPIKEKIEKEFNFKLSDLSLPEQFYLLQFIKNKEAKEMLPVQEFVKKYGEDGLKTFLSLDYGTNLGDKILLLGEKLEPNTAKAIFQKYSEIIDSTQDAFKYFQDNFLHQGAPSQKIIDRIEENLFKKGKNLLVNFSDKISRGEKISEEEILKELENIKAETHLFTSSFKIFKEEAAFIDLADAGPMRYNFELAEEMLGKDKTLLEQMEKIYRENYKNYPQKFTEQLIKSFKESIKNSHAITDSFTILFTLKHKEKLIAFCRLTKNIDKRGVKFWYLGSLNVIPLYKESHLGEALFEETFMEAGALGIPIKADCDPLTPMAQKYIKSGFIATEIYDFEGVPSFRIEYDDKLRNTLESIKLNKKDIFKLREEGIKNNTIVQNWAIDEKPDFKILNQGYLLTQYFTEKDKLYAVFEKDPRLQEQKKAA